MQLSDIRVRRDSVYPALTDWLNIFRESVTTFRRIASEDTTVPESERSFRAAAFAAGYLAILDKIEAEVANSPDSMHPLANCLELCRLREQALRDAGFTDVFRQIKAEENDKALLLLPTVCK